ncbi:polyphosphate kinase 2 family protein [Candidatus Fermentibacteria bacterium]|nr:polyphosphate kinase 2 family protein [Candidatus Fermentibacteria bacterium]
MKRYLVKPKSLVDLSTHDPRDSGAFDGGKKEGRDHLAKLVARLEELQEVLYAENRHRVLVVLQAMDTGGKDGTIRSVFGPLNPQGVRVASFKVPTPEELAHDFLWRIHKQTPRHGEIAVFNRSHYEDVLVVRVRSLMPESVWSKRYERINAFERILAEEGTTILKFFLHIDLAEQKERFQARIDEPAKRWKFNTADLKERKLWPEYVRAYEDALSKTSTKHAPWYIIPANRKWYRNIAVATVVLHTLEGLGMEYPKPAFDPAAIVIE